jgi:predicted DNA-binding transcriptional regulator YafY
MKENRVIAFEYKGYFDDDYKTRLVRPYQLLFDTGVWSLYGYAEERSAIRIFSLSRMKNVSITNESFNLPTDFDYCTQNDGSYFGVFAREKQRFKIAFNEFVAKDIHDRLWTKDQKITELENDEGITVEFTSIQYGKVLSWVLSFGSGASPVEPPELVEQWKENILELYECIDV